MGLSHTVIKMPKKDKKETEKTIDAPSNGGSEEDRYAGLEEGLDEIPPMPQPAVGKDGNGSNPDITAEDLARFQEEEAEREIPGHGFIFGTKKKYLPEVTRVNEREIFTFSVGIVQDAVLKPRGPDDSVFAIFSESVMRLKIGFEGKGRDEYVVLEQQKAQKEADAAAKGAWFGSGNTT